MRMLLVVVGSSFGGLLGWDLGRRFGLYPAIVLASVGTAMGVYLTRRYLRDYF